MKNTWKKWMAVSCALMMTICPLAVTAASGEQDAVVTVETQETNPAMKLATPTDLQPVAVQAEPVEEAAGEPAEEAAAEEAPESVVPSENETKLVDIEEYETPLGSVPAENTTPEVKLVVTAPSDINVRTDADGMSEIFLTLDEGAQLNVLEVKGDWVTVAVDENTIGYVYIGDVQGLPEEMLPSKEEEAEDPTANMKVTIFSSRRSTMIEGEAVYLTSVIEGFEGYEIMYQWQCDKGNGFENVPGANSATYSFNATAETLSWSWYLLVYYR